MPSHVFSLGILCQIDIRRVPGLRDALCCAVNYFSMHAQLTAQVAIIMHVPYSWIAGLALAVVIGIVDADQRLICVRVSGTWPCYK
jgi:hypothetical protein